MSVVYRDREQSRFDDSKSAVSARSGTTKVTRYIVKEDDSRTDYGRASRAEPRQSRYDDSRSNYTSSRFDDSKANYDSKVEETRTIRISRSQDDPYREYSRAYSTADPRYTRETITIRRDEADDRRDEYWHRSPGEDVEDKELVIRRDTERDVTRDGRTSVALSRVDDRRDTQVVSRVDDRGETRYSDYEMANPQRRSFDDRDKEISRYIRTSEHYYPQPIPPPQTIIIRQEPIIIRERERPREEELQVVKKSEIDEERSVSRRSERLEPRDEEYFFEKRVRERIPEEDRRSRLRREVSPGDSISQVGRGRRSRRGSESDDSMVYVRKEKITDYDSRESSEHRKRDLAAGALAGVGAAELIRNHHRKEDKETSSGIGRVAKDAGAGILGAVAAEGIRRYRSQSRRRSRSRSSSGDRYRSRSRRRRSRSRSRSSSNNRFGNLGGNLGGLGLAAAAVAAGALIASKGKKDASPERRSRSRSRRRSSSRGRSVSSSRLSELENDPNADDARNPKHRNSRMAAAGAIGAAAAALLERRKSRSRGRSRSGSPNRLKQAAPIVLTGLGTAALAHRYEKNKAKSEAEEIIRDENRRSRPRSARSRSAGRGNSIYEDAPRQASYSDPSLVSYGHDPLTGNNFGKGYYGNTARAAEPDYYNNSNRAMVPVTAPPPASSSFDATSARSARPRSESRTRSVSSSRSRSRSRGAAAAAAAAGAGIAASAYDQHRKERKQRRHSSRRSSRQQSFDPRASIDPYNGRDPYEDANWHATHSASYAQGMNDPYGSQAGFYPPPPGPMPQQAYAPQQSYTPQQTYTPQQAYAPTPQPQGSSYGPQDFPPPPPGAPQAPQHPYNPYAPNQNPYAPRPRGADDNVSAGYPSSAPTDQHHSTADGLKNEKIMSPPTVGPVVTLQRPSVSTPTIQQPRNNFPGNAENPFARKPSPENPGRGEGRGIALGEVSPGYGGTPQPPEASKLPSRSLSRAAQAYTPVSHNVSAPAQDHAMRLPTPQPNNIPTVTDQPTPLASNANADSSRERDISKTTPRFVPQPHAPAEPSGIPQSEIRASSDIARVPQSAGQPEGRQPEQGRKPEMVQNNASRSFVTPFMPSPDIRPPSDESLPERPYDPFRDFISQKDDLPSMPNLIIPSSEHSKPNAGPTEERAPRPRSPSASGTVTPRPPSPTPANSHKRSVSFNPRLDFNEAPRNIDRHVSDSDGESPSTARHGRRERERETDRDRDRGRDRDHYRDRDRDRDRRGYDGGDDFSEDTPFEDRRRRSYDRGAKDRERRSSRRERTNTQSLDREQDRERHARPRRANTMGGGSSRHHRRDRDGSPGSDETIDLPERFDERGRQKPGSYGGRGERSPEQDLAESIDQILGGLFGKGRK